MEKYYVNTKAQSNGDHEVHTSKCQYLPSTEHRKYLGEFSSCDAAVRAAKDIYPKSNGCKTCSDACHTS